MPPKRKRQKTIPTPQCSFPITEQFLLEQHVDVMKFLEAVGNVHYHKSVLFSIQSHIDIRKYIREWIFVLFPRLCMFNDVDRLPKGPKFEEACQARIFLTLRPWTWDRILKISSKYFGRSIISLSTKSTCLRYSLGTWGKLKGNHRQFRFKCLKYKNYADDTMNGIFIQSPTYEKLFDQIIDEVPQFLQKAKQVASLGLGTYFRKTIGIQNVHPVFSIPDILALILTF